jgi:DNA-binding NarL/FixJ family response regulator
MNILVVDDEKDIFNSIQLRLKKQKNIQILPRCDFDNVIKNMDIYKVDMIILDLSNGIDRDTEAGKIIINNIYKHSFLPVIIFSGFSDDFDNPFKDNYFIKTVKKGKTGITELRKAVKEFLPFIEKQILVSKELSTDISEIYRNTYQKLISNAKLKNVNTKSEIFTRLMKRRLAASIDEASDDSRINAWEIYLYPCLGNEYLTGDILRKKRSTKNDPTSYKIILSPSCDLQKGQKPIQNVKVACFKNIKDNFSKNNLKISRLRDTSPNRFMFFHKLEGEFPHMVCDFKEIEIIKFTDLNKYFERIVSIDSPFRESIVWADITINGRPGLPDRNCDDWLADIKAECYTEKTNDKS